MGRRRVEYCKEAVTDGPLGKALSERILNVMKKKGAHGWSVCHVETFKGIGHETITWIFFQRQEKLG